MKPRAMVNVSEIRRNEKLDPDEDWVVIQRMPNGKYRGFGYSSALGDGSVGFYGSAMFDSLDDAVRHATDWASAASVSVVYVRSAR